MKEILLRLLTDTAAFTFAGGILLFAGRKILNGAIEHYFARLGETSKASIDLEKQKESFLISTRSEVYPEIVALVYRLRNNFRDGLEDLKHSASHPDDKWFPPVVFRFGEPLYLMTERLYKYRAFVPEEVFENLHRFKRCLQDATVMLNRLDRPVDSEGQKIDDVLIRSRDIYLRRYAESIGELERLYSEVDILYPKITDSIKAHMNGILSRTT